MKLYKEKLTFNFKNKLWKTNPQKAREGLQRELQAILDECLTLKISRLWDSSATLSIGKFIQNIFGEGELYEEKEA